MIVFFKKKSTILSIVVIGLIILVGTFVIIFEKNKNEAFDNSTKKSIAAVTENNTNKSSQSNNESNNVEEDDTAKSDENNSGNADNANNTNVAEKSAEPANANANANSSSASQSTTSPMQPKQVPLKTEQSEVQHSQPVQKPNPAQSQKYVSKTLGFSLTFPASWQGKYNVVENSNELTVYFKPVNHPVGAGIGRLFEVVKKTPDVNEGVLDTISGAKRYFIVKGVTFVIGGPTDVGFPPDNPEYSTYKQLSSERSTVINSIQSIN